MKVKKKRGKTWEKAREEAEGAEEEEGEEEEEGQGRRRRRKKRKMKREKVKKKRTMTRRVAMILGASQPTLALGRQTSNCHVGQDNAGKFTSGSSWTISSGTARCSSASSGRLLSKHWTDS